MNRLSYIANVMVLTQGADAALTQFFWNDPASAIKS